MSSDLPAVKEVTEKIGDVSLEDPKKPRWGKLDDNRNASEVLGTVQRHKVFFSRPFGDVTLTEFFSIDCDGAPLMECFPSVGLFGVMTGKYVVKHLKLPLIGFLHSENFPVACVVQNEQPSYPVRIYGDQRLVVFMSEMGLSVPPEQLNAVVESIYDFAHRHRCPMIYSLEGIPRPDSFEVDGQQVQIRMPGGEGDGEEGEGEGEEEGADESIIIDDTLLAKMTLREAERKQKDEKLVPPPSPQKVGDSSVKRKKAKKSEKKEEEEKGIDEIADELFGKKIHYVTTSLEVAQKLRDLGHIPLVDGIIPGVTGGILAQAPLTEQEVTAILAPTSLVLPQPESSIPVLKLLQEFIPKCDFASAIKDLEEEGSDLHKILSGLLQQGLAEKKGKNVPFGIYG